MSTEEKPKKTESNPLLHLVAIIVTAAVTLFVQLSKATDLEEKVDKIQTSAAKTEIAVSKVQGEVTVILALMPHQTPAASVPTDIKVP